MKCFFFPVTRVKFYRTIFCVINLAAFPSDLKKAVHDILQSYNTYVNNNRQRLAKQSELQQIYQQ